jgi:HSP20 family protein
MSLIKWEPFDELDRFFGDFSAHPALRVQNIGFDLAVDLYEDGNMLVAEMQLPGMHGEDINVEVVDTTLSISGKREEVEEKKEKNHYTKEIRRGSFERIIQLPDSIEQGSVVAEYTQGVLTVRMQKRNVEKNGKVKVEVK